MKIELIIRREGGTSVDVGGTTYLFAPGDDERHVCVVEDEKHIEKLLSIPEGYREVVSDERPVNEAPEAQKAEAKGGKRSPKEKPVETA